MARLIVLKVDIVLDDARAPSEGEADGDGVEVEAQALREGENRGWRVALDLAHPGQQLAATAVLEQVVEGAREVAGPGDVGAGQADTQEFVLLTAVQGAAGQHDPFGDPAGLGTAPRAGSTVPVRSPAT